MKIQNQTWLEGRTRAEPLKLIVVVEFKEKKLTLLMSEKRFAVILEDLRSNDLVCSFCGMKTIPKNIIIHICTDCRQWVTYWSCLYYSCTTTPFLHYLEACICNIQKNYYYYYFIKKIAKINWWNRRLFAIHLIFKNNYLSSLIWNSSIWGSSSEG